MATKEYKRAPVKLGCLACRASHTRCDGKPTCDTCSTKNRTCSYTKSNRGGPRISRKKLEQMQRHAQDLMSRRSSSMSPKTSSASQEPQDGNSSDDQVRSFIAPGAGLKMLPTDFVFDAPFETCLDWENVDVLLDNLFGSKPDEQPAPYVPLCRAYGSDFAVLNAYYTFVHSYFPILPPPESAIVVDIPLSNGLEDFEPSSPISLALSAILALIPHPDDPLPQSKRSVQYRRMQAELFSQMAMESVEIESEILASAISPADALSGEPSVLQRKPFHPSAPIELEGILALLVLSGYEYTQRGNLVKMRNRSSQALDAALRLSLHQEDDTVTRDEFTEARRRAWWMTYVCVSQGSIVSSTPPVFVEHTIFCTPFPSNETDHEAWSAFLDAQQLILKCTQYTVSLKKALERGSDLTDVQNLMLVLDDEIDCVTSKYCWETHDLGMYSDDFERTLAHSLKMQAIIKLHSSKIKLHRYGAFLNAPIFTKKHCDLERTRDASVSCCSLFPQHIGEPVNAQLPSPPAQDDFWDTPFCNVNSAKICMRAALAISRAFESLPYPDPALFSLPQAQAPRTMPIFACCAMQSSYALLMLCDKGRHLNGTFSINFAMSNGMIELHSGLRRVLNALQNYAISFEAIDGMRAQVQEAFNFAKQANHEQMSRI